MLGKHGKQFEENSGIDVLLGIFVLLNKQIRPVFAGEELPCRPLGSPLFPVTAQFGTT